MTITRKHTIPGIFFFISAAVLLMQPALGALPEAGKSAAPRQYGLEKQDALRMGQVHVAMQAFKASWQPVAQVEFLPAEQKDAVADMAGGVRTSKLSWRITASGTVVQDNRTGALARIPELTSAMVRPREVVYDRHNKMVWFYGAGLYRYRLGGHQLERLQSPGKDWPVIRKMAFSSAGMWLVTSGNIYLLDGADGTLKTLQDAALVKQHFTNLAATGKLAWVTTADQHLIRISALSPHRIALDVSNGKLPGVAAELTAVGQDLWLLLANRHGDRYRLAVVDQKHQSIGMMAGRYYSLTESGGQLVAGAYATEYRIDTVNKTAVPVKTMAAGLLMQAQRRDAVLFAGSSYGYKDGCEIVEHGQLDISKGWVNALNEPHMR